MIFDIYFRCFLIFPLYLVICNVSLIWPVPVFLERQKRYIGKADSKFSKEYRSKTIVLIALFLAPISLPVCFIAHARNYIVKRKRRTPTSN